MALLSLEKGKYRFSVYPIRCDGPDGCGFPELAFDGLEYWFETPWGVLHRWKCPDCGRVMWTHQSFLRKPEPQDRDKQTVNV